MTTHTISVHCRQHGPAGEYVRRDIDIPGIALPLRGDTMFVAGWDMTVLYSALVVDADGFAGVDIRLDFLNHDEFEQFRAAFEGSPDEPR